MVITIDGLSATGKSTVAKKLADTLHYLYFNTGLIYRMITYVMLEEHLREPEEVIARLNTLSFKLFNDHLLLNGKDITNYLYTEDISLCTSKYSTIPEIKKWVVKVQKEYLAKGNIIMEGRDIGSRIAPLADIKFYLYASIDARAKRLCMRNNALTLEDAKKELETIDEKNMTSKDFIQPIDAIFIDTSNLSEEEVYEKMLAFIREKLL